MKWRLLIYGWCFIGLQLAVGFCKNERHMQAIPIDICGVAVCIVSVVCFLEYYCVATAYIKR